MKSYYVRKASYGNEGYAEVYDDFTYMVIRNSAGYLAIKKQGYFPVNLYNEMPSIQIADKIRKILKMHTVFCTTILKANIIEEESDYSFSDADSIIRVYGTYYATYISDVRLHRLAWTTPLKGSFISKETYNKIEQATAHTICELDKIWKEIEIAIDNEILRQSFL